MLNYEVSTSCVDTSAQKTMPSIILYLNSVNSRSKVLYKLMLLILRLEFSNDHRWKSNRSISDGKTWWKSHRYEEVWLGPSWSTRRWAGGSVWSNITNDQLYSSGFWTIFSDQSVRDGKLSNITVECRALQQRSKPGCDPRPEHDLWWHTTSVW